MLERLFHLKQNNTTVRTELLAGLTTFLTMAYIIFLQPEVMTGKLFEPSMGAEVLTGMDAGAVTAATCLAAALATAVMGLYARYPIAQAPGMGENVFFTLTLVPFATRAFAPAIAAGTTTAWQVALGVIFLSGVLFLLLSLLGVREKLLEAISPSMRAGIAVGIGLFIAFIGLRNTHLIVQDPGTAVKLNVRFTSPDLVVFFWGLLVTAGLHALRVRGSIVWGILAATVLALLLRGGLPLVAAQAAQSELVQGSMLMQDFRPAAALVSRPPSVAPTLLKMDLVRAASVGMLPFVLIFLFMDLFDTLGTLIGVGEQAGLVKDNHLPRARQALLSDALGTVAGAALGTSTVTSFIESAAGVEQGGRTGLTALTVSGLFVLALFFYPIIDMVGSYPPITAPALVVVGCLMMRNVVRIEWDNFAESFPAFLVALGIPLTYSIADGLALGFVTYPLVKLVAGQGRRVHWLMYTMAAVLVAYFLLVRMPHAGV